VHSGNAQARWVRSWSHVCSPPIVVLFPNARDLWANLSSGGNRPREPVDAFGAQGQDRGVASTRMDPILPCPGGLGWRAHRVPLCEEIVNGYRARRRLPLPGTNSQKSPLIMMSYSKCAQGLTFENTRPHTRNCHCATSSTGCRARKETTKNLGAYQSGGRRGQSRHARGPGFRA
jgi:hypothetical protein